MSIPVQWNAVYTRRLCEKKVCSLLEKKGITYYHPQNKTRVAGSAPERFTTVPLFPSIIFVQPANAADLLSISKIPHVINILYWKQQPAAFPAAEIDLLRHFLEVHEMVQVVKTGLQDKNRPALETQTGGQSPLSGNMLILPSMGYSLSAITERATSITMLRKNRGRYDSVDTLAFMLGLKTSNGEIE